MQGSEWNNKPAGLVGRTAVAPQPACAARERVQAYETALLALAILAGLSVRLVFFTGLIGSDDLTYADAARYMFSSEHERPFEDATAGGVAIRRIGLNLPLFLAMQAFGVSEQSLALAPLLFSLAGIPIVWGLLRLWAGPGAGLTAAWLWALLPVDVYTATLWLPDNVFATVFATFLLFLALSERSQTGRWAALFAGVALGYLEYVKEIAYVFIVPLAAHAAYTWWRTRRLNTRVIYVVVGFVFVQVLAAWYFWSQGGHPLVFWRMAFLRYTDVMLHFDQRNPFPQNLVLTWRYLTEQWAFGYGVVVFAPLMLIGLLSKSTPMRGRLFMFLLLQAYIVYEGVKLGHWTQRYLLQASPTVLALVVMGLWVLLSRLPQPRNRRALALAGTALVLATGVALRPERQQHGRFRAQVLRDAHAYLAANAAADDPIYLVASNEYWKGAVPFYTKRALELLSGHRPFKGGFHDLAEAYAAQSGWVVLSHLEGQYLNLGLSGRIWGIASNWLEVFRAQTPQNRRYYASVYKILPAVPPAFVCIIDKPMLPAPLPDVSRHHFEPAVLFGSLEGLRSPRWSRRLASQEIQATEEGLRCALVAEAGTDQSSRGGVRLRVPGLAALVADLEIAQPENVRSVCIYANGNASRDTIKWQWRLSDAQRRGPNFRTRIALVPGKPAGYFRASGDLPPEEVREVHVFVELNPGTAAGFTLRELQVAAPTAAPADEPAAFTTIALDGPPDSYRLRNIGASRSADVHTWARGLRCDIVGDPDSQAHQYGGFQLPVDGLHALRFKLGLIDPQNIVGVWVDGLDERRARVLRWEWLLSAERPAFDVGQTYTLQPEQSDGYFETVTAGDGAAVREIRVFARIKPGTEAGLLLWAADVEPVEEKAIGAATAPVTSSDDVSNAP